jgi:sialic acid synthase SpsE
MNYQQLVANSESRLFIIAEAGVNHNGDIKNAYKLVDAAVDAGCDAVKFQTWITDKVYSREKSIKPDYQVHTTDSSETEYETIKKLELSYDDFRLIKNYCDDKGIIFFSTPDEIDSADYLCSLGVGLMKTASQDVTNIPFLKKIGSLGVPVIFSTGASTMSELASGVEAILSQTSELIILHCVSAYPAPMSEMNLNVIKTLKLAFNHPVGLSDHTTGVEAACAAVALGARIFEKHLTINKSMIGPDHQASLDPKEMKAYCTKLRSTLSSLGSGVKHVMPCEENTRKAFRRFIVAARDLPMNHIIQEKDVYFKKVVSGISPDYLGIIINSKIKNAILEDAPLSWDLLDLSAR